MLLFSYGSFRKDNPINDSNMTSAEFKVGSTEDVSYISIMSANLIEHNHCDIESWHNSNAVSR